MFGLLIAATFILSLCALASHTLNRRHHAMQRMILLGGMVTTLVLPLAAKLTECVDINAIVPTHAFAPAKSVDAGTDAHALLFFAWIVGLALMSIRLGWHAWLVCGIAARSRSLHTKEVAVISSELTLLDADQASRFRLSDEIETPMVIAGARQIVLVPARWFQWSSRLRASSLRHEWRHVQSADAQWGVLVALFRVVLWFHPLAWWVSARWSEECELLADLAATSACDSVDYAHDLLSLAGESHVPALELATAFAPRSQSRLERRLRAVLEGAGHRLPCGRFAIAAVLSAFAAAAVLISALFHSPAKSTAAQLEAEAQTRLEANPFPADR